MSERRKRTQFWGRDPADDSLVREILDGRKTATVDEASEYDRPHGRFDSGAMRVGDLVDVYDLRGRLRCAIRITEVYPVRFGAVPEKLWRGEGFASAEEFREVHRRVWPGYDLHADFEMIATHFELAEVHDAEGSGTEGLPMIEMLARRFDEPDEVRHFEKGKFEILRVGSMTLGRASYEPGWRWSEHVGKAGGQTSCRVDHAGMVLSGRAAVSMDDGRQIVLGPGDCFAVGPGHDSWVVGDEPYVSLHFLGADEYARAKDRG